MTHHSSLERTHPSSLIPHPFRIVIIGGGISGLACAHRLTELAGQSRTSLDVTLIEASPRFGGIIHTATRDGFTLERGPDAFIAEKPAARALAERLGIANRLIGTNEKHRRSFLVRNSRLRPVPEGFRLLAPAKLSTFLRSDAFPLTTRARIAFEMFLPRGAQREDESLASFVRRRFGNDALRRIAQPMVGGIYTADPEKLSLRATMPRFLEMEQLDRSLILSLRRAAKQQRKAASAQLDTASQTLAANTADADDARSTSGARYNLFLSFDKGMNVIVDELVARLDTFARTNTNSHATTNVSLRFNTAAQSLVFDKTTNKWSVKLDTRETLIADAVCLALPAHAASRLLAKVGSQLATELGNIAFASTATVNFAYKLEDIPHPLDGFGFVVPFIERRTALACTFAHRKFANRAPQGYALLRAFAGGALQPEVFALDDSELINYLRKDFRDLLGITRPPVFTDIARWRDSMPQYHVGHLGRIAQIETHTRNHQSLHLSGNYARGAGVPDCIGAGESAAEKIMLEAQQSV